MANFISLIGLACLLYGAVLLSAWLHAPWIQWTALGVLLVSLGVGIEHTQAAAETRRKHPKKETPA